jgi:predicted transcriptional regulator
MRYLKRRYEGESPVLNLRVTPELLERIDARAKELKTSRSLLVRSALEMFFLPAEETKARIEDEQKALDWIRAGCPDDQDPSS